MKPDAAAVFRAAAEVPDCDDAEARRQECPVCGASCRLSPKTGAMPPHQRLGQWLWCSYAGKRPLTAEEREAADARERGPSDADIAEARAQDSEAQTGVPTLDEACSALRGSLMLVFDGAAALVAASHGYHQNLLSGHTDIAAADFRRVAANVREALALVESMEHEFAMARAHAVLSGESAT